MLGSARNVPKSWSSTLLLPRSAFPPRALAADRAKYLKRCTEDLYAWQREKRTGDTFTLHDGPPYANGSLHVGHALNKILKDILCRFKLSQGYKVNYVPGWDCHGLPIELKAIEQHASLALEDSNKSAKAVLVREAARKLAGNAVEEQKRSFQQWGIMADWDHAWKTMDKTFELKQLSVFKDLVRKGLIYRRFKPVYWSPSSRTALAESELEYQESHVSTAAFVKYPIQRLPRTVSDSEGGGLNAVIWTTTPWTLPANKAIGIHSELEYAIVMSERHGRLLVAKTRLEEVEKACKDIFSILSVIQGSQLVEATYNDSAFAGDIRPFLHADFVSADSGSGLVHLAPGHGKDDYHLCVKHNITAFAPLDDEGRFTKLASPNDPELLYGKEVLYGGNRAVVDHLTSKGLLLTSHKFKHKYPYDWRSKQPVIVRATEQWFADVGGVQDGAIKSLDAVRFIPGGGKERLRSFVKNRSEWCISRQRAWGVPIPAIYEKETGQAVLTEESITHVMGVIEDRGIDAWWTDDAWDPAWVPPSLRRAQPKTAFIRGKDTMDVWFDSGTSWTQIVDPKTKDSKITQADVYLEGSDQHRGWFQSSLLLHIAQQQATYPMAQLQAPFKTLITHGFTLDERSHKMSKSVGNVISPDQIMDGTLLPPLKRKAQSGKSSDTADTQPSYDGMGPDALRLWVASCDFTNDVIISRAVLKGINGTLSKYRVTFKLLLGMLDDFDSQATTPIFKHLGPVNQIALMQLRQAVEKVLYHYEQCDFNRAVQEINRYINTDLSSFYVESIKDTIYADSRHARQRTEVQSVLLQIFSSLQAILYPVTPLLIEEALDYAPNQVKNLTSNPLLREPAMVGTDGQWKNETLEEDLPWLLRANGAVKIAQEEARASKKMGSSLQCEVLFQVAEAQGGNESHALQSLKRYRSTLETLLVVSGVDFCQASLLPAVQSAEWEYHADFDLLGSKVTAHVYTPTKAKCIRCWKYDADTTVETKGAICGRCEGVMEELRETRPELFEHTPISAAAIPA